MLISIDRFFKVRILSEPQMEISYCIQSIDKLHWNKNKVKKSLHPLG